MKHFLLILTTVFYLCSCNNDNDKIIPKKSLEEIDGRNYSGQILKHISSDIVDVICIDTDLNKKDYELLIAIQHYGANFDNLCGECKIIKKKRSFIINNQGFTYCYNIDDNISSISIDTTYTEFIGYSFQEGKFNAELDDIIYEDIDKIRKSRLKNGNDCITGGPGSKSCSLNWKHPSLTAGGHGLDLGGQSVSTECYNGLYACCYLSGIILKANCFSSTNSSPGMCYADTNGKIFIGWTSSMEECFRSVQGRSFRYPNGQLIEAF